MLKRIGFAALVLILLFMMVFSGLRILESTVLYQGADEDSGFVSKTISRDGVDYYPRTDITVIMVLGIDEMGPVQASESYRNEGEADAIFLVILDQTEESFTVLGLNRDTMVEMPALGIGGREAGTFYGQLALSHTYGDGLAESCENTRATISGLLYGIDIDHYVAMNMDGIAIVNDAVGGVTVTVEEDFSSVDPSIPMGRVTLKSEQALNYVRTRMGIGDQLNITRMERHKEYMNGMMTAMRESMDASDTFVLELYEQAAPYLVTDCSVNVISGLMERCADYTLKEIVSPEGDNIIGEEYYEFHLDEQKLDELILRLFYAEKP